MFKLILVVDDFNDFERDLYNLLVGKIHNTSLSIVSGLHVVNNTTKDTNLSLSKVTGFTHAFYVGKKSKVVNEILNTNPNIQKIFAFSKKKMKSITSDKVTIIRQYEHVSRYGIESLVFNLLLRTDNNLGIRPKRQDISAWLDYNISSSFGRMYVKQPIGNELVDAIIEKYEYVYYNKIGVCLFVMFGVGGVDYEVVYSDKYLIITNDYNSEVIEIGSDSKPVNIVMDSINNSTNHIHKLGFVDMDTRLYSNFEPFNELISKFGVIKTKSIGNTDYVLVAIAGIDIKIIIQGDNLTLYYGAQNLRTKGISIISAISKAFKDFQRNY